MVKRGSTEILQEVQKCKYASNLLWLCHLATGMWFWGLPWWLSGKESTGNAGDVGVWSLGWKDSLEKEMATHSNILAWRIPWKEEPCRLQSMRSPRVRHDWVYIYIYARNTMLACSIALKFCLSPSHLLPMLRRNSNIVSCSCTWVFPATLPQVGYLQLDWLRLSKIKQIWLCSEIC